MGGLTATLVAAGSLAAQQTSERELLDSQRRLEQIQRERGEVRREISSLRTRGEDISGDLQNLERRTGTSSAVIDELQLESGERNAQIERTARDLFVTRDRLGDRRAVLHRRLRDIYKRGPLQAVEVLLTAESFGDLINRYRYLFLIARHDRLLVREVSALETELATRERSLQRTLSALQDAQTETAMERDQLSVLEGHQRHALATVSSRELSAARRLEQLDRDERALRTLLATVERRRRAGVTLGARPGVSLGATAAALTTADMGGLSWPVQGNILYRFGRAAQANGTAIRWNGIGIGAAAGSAVRAVEAGTVVLAGPFEGYGPTVVLSHGGGYYSLYLYLRETGVREGDPVARNQSVGTVGGAATPEGTHVELQIRGPDGAAVDPLPWLQQRRAQ